MNLNELEKGLKNYKSASPDKIDTETLWNEVSPHIPQFKKRDSRRFFIFFFFLCACMAALYLINSDSMNKDQELTMENSVNSTRKTQNLVAKNENENNILDKQIDEQLPQANKLTRNKSISSDGLAMVNANNFSEVASSVKSITKESSVQSDDIINNLNNQYDITTSPTKKLNTSIEYFAVNNGSTLKGLTSIARRLRNDKTGVSDNDQTIAFQASNDTPELNNSTKFSKLFVLEEKQSRELIDLGVIPLTSLLIADVEMPVMPKRLYLYNKQSRYKGSIEIGGAYFIPSRSLTLNNQEFENEFASRNAAEEILDAWNSTIAFRYMVHPNIGLRVGLQYLVINERSTKQLNLSETLFIEDTIIGNFVRLDGISEPIRGDIELNRTITRRVSRINTFRLIQIPIEVFYAQRLNKLQFELGAGVIQNISTSSSGFWHPDDQSEYDLSLDQNDYIKSRIGMSFTGRAGISYPLNRNFDLFSNIRYVTSINGFTNSNYGINQSYTLIGADLGIRINLIK